MSYDLMNALNSIDPATLDYKDWVEVGMALHAEGYPASVWRDWSMRDHARFNERDFETKWRGFGHSAGGSVKGGTIIKLAKDAGWTPERQHRAIDWGDTIGGGYRRRPEPSATVPAPEEPALIDPTMVGEFDASVEPMFPAGRECDELRLFLEALFEDGEYIGYVTEYTEKTDEDGNVRLVPGNRGVYTRTAGDIKEGLTGSVENALSCTLHEESGAWIRVNPLDGEGVGNSNVSAYRHALLESDDMPVGKFAAIVKQLNIPVTCLVDSGGKSLHAIVRIDADDARQYRERIETLYARCEKNGIAVDRANKNPSRLCRMPGVTRRGRRQFLAGLAQGAADWDEWDEWYQAETDDLPDANELDIDIDGERPDVPPALIEGTLRVRDKMLLAGPSKAGKSFALMELCGAFATGGEWFGHECRKSRALYINLELTSDSCKARFYDVFTSMGVGSKEARNTVIWNLKGKGRALDRLAKALVRRAVKKRAEVCIIDPIYKVMAGDENNARDIGEFTNVLDQIAEDAGISVIYCHHHSKGYQGEKRSIDRASGSGVFGRDADAVVDMIELDPDEGVRNQYVNRKQIARCREVIDELGLQDKAEERGIPWDARQITDVIDKLDTVLDGETWARLRAECDEMERTRHALTAWRIESTLREFPKTEPVYAWFDWPVHVMDMNLKGSPEMGSVSTPGKSGRASDESKDEKRKRLINEGFEYAVNACADDGVEPTRSEVRSRFPKIDGKVVTDSQIKKWTTDSKTPWCEWVNSTANSEPGGCGKVVKKTPETPETTLGRDPRDGAGVSGARPRDEDPESDFPTT